MTKSKHPAWEALLKEYGEVSSNFRLLTDIRFKLLALLPIATAAAAAMKGDSPGVPNLVISSFGLAATIGLWIYNSRNDQLYDELVGRACEIERTLGIPDGAFCTRPGDWFTPRLFGMRVGVNHGTGVTTIYVACATFWMFGIYTSVIGFLLTEGLVVQRLGARGVVIAAQVVALGLAVLTSGLCSKSIRAQKKARHEKMRDDARRAVRRLEEIPMSAAADDEEFMRACMALTNDKEARDLESRAKFYGKLEPTALGHFMPTEPREIVAAHFVSLVTDQSPRWILDCLTGRRKAVSAASTSRG